MASQPANQSISVFRRVRTKRNDGRYDSIASLTKKLRELIMVIPGEEITAGALTRDSSVSDFSSYMGQPNFDSTRGFPIVYGLYAQKAFSDAQENLPEVDFAITIGRDAFIQNTEAGLGNDLFADLADDAIVPVIS